MRRSLWLPLLAILSVLLHGAATARHHAAMLGNASGHAQLLADLGVICSPGLATSSAAALPNRSAGGPLEGPGGGQANTDCPVCLGLVAGVIFATASVTFVAPERQFRSYGWSERAGFALAFDTDWPPGTGPPAIS